MSNWLRCESGEILGLRHVRRFEVEAGEEARTKTRHHADGGYSSTTYLNLPGNGWLVLAHLGHGPECIGRYDSETLARKVLVVIFAELREGARAIDVPVISDKLRRQGPGPTST